MAAKNAGVTREVFRFIRPNQSHSVTHLRQMTRSRRPDQAPPDHRDFYSSACVHNQLLPFRCLRPVQSG
jgi:hypothetical protein